MSLYMYGKERQCVKYLQLTFSYFYNLLLRFFDLGGFFFNFVCIFELFIL